MKTKVTAAVEPSWNDAIIIIAGTWETKRYNGIVLN